MFDFDLAESVESGDLFFCLECHEVTEGDFCPYCHAGKCDRCSIPLTVEEIGDREPNEPFMMLCKACYMHENGIAAPCATPATIRFMEALNKVDSQPKLTLTERNALSLLR